MSEQNSNESAQQNFQVHVAPDLDYCYRDVANIYVGAGAGDVVFEFGNIHRSMPGNITIGNRLVMSMANAIELQQKLSQVLEESQKQLQEQIQEQLKQQQQAK